LSPLASTGEVLLALLLRARKIEFVQEYRFAPPRRWRFDFAQPDHKVAIEVEGGSWVGGRHNRGTGFAADCEKYNEATRLGWKVIRLTPKMIEDGSWERWLEVLQ
jgi:very-short-patch-repair endonuclease